MPTTDDGQGMVPLHFNQKGQIGDHIGNSKFAGGVNMHMSSSQIGKHMSAGHLDSLKDVYGEARREESDMPLLRHQGDTSSFLTMKSPLNDYELSAEGVAPTKANEHPGHHDDKPLKMDDALYMDPRDY